MTQHSGAVADPHPLQVRNLGVRNVMTRSFMPGCGLTELDLRNLEASWITRELAEQAMLRRVDSSEGARIVGRSDRGDYSGIVFPHFLPGHEDVREYILRRDHPDYESDGTGNPKPRKKYLFPPGRANMLYFVPGSPVDWLHDRSIPVTVVEGAKKALALWRLGWHEVPRPRWAVIGLSGVWNWRGTVGKTTGANGDRCDVKGPIPDLNLITWTDRRVLIVFDANARVNQNVAAARVALSNELTQRGAEVLWVELPEVLGVNGVDELLAIRGPDALLPVFSDFARPFRPSFNTTDYGNAERLTTLCGTDIRFCHEWRKWLCWDGTRWLLDESGAIERFAKQTVRKLYREAMKSGSDWHAGAMNPKGLQESWR